MSVSSPLAIRTHAKRCAVSKGPQPAPISRVTAASSLRNSILPGTIAAPPKDQVNAALSLAYTLLHTDAVIACHAAGLDPLIGFYHDLSFSRESLACDLVEPLRPRVDAYSTTDVNNFWFPWFPSPPLS